MKYKLPFLFILALFFTACGDDESKELTLNFKLNYGDDPLIFFENLSYPDGRDFEFTRFSFYISEIELGSNGESTIVNDVDYIDLTASHSSLSSAENGYDYTLEFDEPGNYDQLRFNLGLTDAQNSTVPADYPSSSALSLTGEYWSNWESYVYVKIEGRTDIDGDGISDGIALHLGSEAALRAFEVSNLDSDERLNITIDARKIFEQNGNIYDIVATPRIHSLNQMDKTIALMDNLSGSIEISR